LRGRYVHIADLNAAWNADFGDFGDARAVLTPQHAAYVERYLDASRFRHWYATDVIRWTSADYRGLGVDVPISDEHRGVLDAIRYARGAASTAVIPEFESGIWHGWHRHVGTLTATHYELNGYTALQPSRSWSARSASSTRRRYNRCSKRR
jgi:hypothetical protein